MLRRLMGVSGMEIMDGDFEECLFSVDIILWRKPERRVVRFGVSRKTKYEIPNIEFRIDKMGIGGSVVGYWFTGRHKTSGAKGAMRMLPSVLYCSSYHANSSG